MTTEPMLRMAIASCEDEWCQRNDRCVETNVVDANCLARAAKGE